MRGYFELVYHKQSWRGEDGRVSRDGREFPEDPIRWSLLWQALKSCEAWNRWEPGSGHDWWLEARRGGYKLACRGGVEPDWLPLLLRLLSGYDPDIVEPSDALELSSALGRLRVGEYRELAWPLAFRRKTLCELAEQARGAGWEEAREMVDRLDVSYDRQRLLLQARDSQELARRAEELAAGMTDVDLALEAFAESPYPALHELLEMGEEARAALPLVARYLQGVGWENSGAEDGEERALLKDGWRLYRRWATAKELLEALEWGNSRAVAEACEELWERGHDPSDFVQPLVWAVGGAWGPLAGKLLRKLGDVGQDETLWLWLENEAGRGASAALGARHPARLVNRLLQRKRDVEAMLWLAGPEAIPAIIQGLYNHDPEVRLTCQQVLLRYQREELAGWLPRHSLLPPYGINGKLACLLWDWNPAALGVWAETAGLEALQQAFQHVQLQLASPGGGYGRSHFFLQAAGQCPVSARDLQRGLRDSDVGTVYCALRAARRLAEAERPQLEPALKRLRENEDPEIAAELQALQQHWASHRTGAAV
ncbi:MAG: hypothetical protein KF760_24950 [Candidatus Eremiobacteraeota bacterium]|nr:hypothetical protein [Candidatus Eremiobacteraeota bacterium]MCW5870717.1 hypothetical protein [Candidatus Eremiobacteraeota bacterium]